MPDDFVDKRNGAYDVVSPEGRELHAEVEDGRVREVLVDPMPQRLARRATDPLNAKTGRRPTE